MANRIPHRELRNNSSAVLRRVQAGETFEVTNHGDVVAILTPPEQGVALRVIAAKVPGGFGELPRVKVSEQTSEVLEDIRGE